MNIQDMLLLGGILLGVGIVLWISAFMGGEVLDRVAATPVIAANANAVSAINHSSAVFTRFDIIFMGFFVGFMLFTWISAFFIGGNPVFVWLYVMVMALVLLITPALANVWMSWTDNVTIAATVTIFPLTDAILSSLPLYVFIIELVGFVILFSKGRGEQSGYN